MFIAILISLVVGALATSYAEYKLQYNLFDYIHDAIHGVESSIVKTEAKLAALKSKV